MDFFTGQQRTVMTKCSIVYLHLQNKSFVLLVHIRPEEYTKLNKALDYRCTQKPVVSPPLFKFLLDLLLRTITSQAHQHLHVVNRR